MLHGFLPSLLSGALITLGVAFGALALALVLGLAGAFAKLSRWAPARWLAVIYTTVIRGVPDLLLVLLIYFGGQVLLNWLAPQLGHTDYVDIDPFVAGVLTLGFIFGAYLTEVFRGAFMAVPPGQREAAIAFGMGPWLTARRVTLPLMARHALPGVANTWLVLIKSTAIVSQIGLADLMTRGHQAAGSTREPFAFFLAVALIYLAFTGLSELALAQLQRRFSLGVRANAL